VTAERVTAFARERMGEDNRAYLVFVPKAQGDEGIGELVGAEAHA
jgi:hypothetical protein